jgi:hypothetical protein
MIVPVDPVGLGIAEPLNCALPATYETAPGLEGSVTAMSSRVTAEVPLLVTVRV